ncbi:MAG: hypothetical protein KDB23_23710, partial [Planctomycetales bacterium]|nr:hypothetical protein [Planctomycetales bacterium]
MNDLKFAFRQLLKNPGFTVVAVLTLALGIGATTATVSAVRGALIDPIPVDHPERFVSLHATDIESGRRSHGLNPVAAREAEAAKDLFEQVILWKRHTANDNLTFE